MVVTAAQNPSKPRIISEVKKSCFPKIKLGFTTSLQDFGKPKITGNAYEQNASMKMGFEKDNSKAESLVPAPQGQLIWNASPSEWLLRMAEVRNGSLFVFKDNSSGVEFRLPLRQLSLQPCSAPRTFRLTQAQDVPLVTFQALTDEDYEKWVKTLAVELLRQTPLQDIRFLDIISITRKRDIEKTNMRRGRSEECLVLVDETLWNRPQQDQNTTDFARNRRYRSLTLDTAACEQQNIRRQKALRNKYDFKEDIKKRVNKSEWFNDDQNDSPENESDENFDLVKPKLCRPVKIRSSPSSDGERKIKEALRLSSENAINLESGLKHEREKSVSDESGISSGDENNNTIMDADVKNSNQEFEIYSFVSVREKKKFFESLNSDAEGSTSPAESLLLLRSNSIGDLKKGSEESTKLKRRKRTKSLHDLSRTPVPVREICRLFEPQGKDQDDAAINEMEDNVTDEISERNAMFMLNQRRLQRGERKLAKLGIQIAEVEETIKVIADDLKSMVSNPLKRREGAEIFAALQRRLAEENSRLERLQDETTRVIKENQRTIAKLKKSEEK